MRVTAVQISSISTSMWTRLGIFALLAIACMAKILDYDIWYHLSIGREIISTWSIPDTEFLVYTNSGKPAMLHEWGFGVLVYLVHQASGINGLIIFNGLLIATILMILISIGRKDLAASTAKIIAVAVAFYCLFPSRYMRVELFLYLAVACEFYFLERFYVDAQKKWLVPIPIIALVLTQLHPSAIFLLYFFGCYALFWLWLNRGDRQLQLKYFRWFTVTGLATIICASINPYGIDQLLEPFFFAQNNKTINYIVEFRPALSMPITASTFLFLSSVAVLSVIVDRERRLLNLVFALTFGFLAFKYWRNLTLYALVLFIPASRMLTMVFESIREKVETKTVKLFETAFILVAISILLSVVAHRIYLSDMGFGVRSVLPTQSVRIINQIKPPRRLFNSYEFGGYLGWAVEENNQVFVDGRNYRVWRSFAANKSIIQAKQGWQEGLQRYKVSTIVISPLTPLAEQLLQGSEWWLAHLSDSEALFFRKTDVPNLPDQYKIDRLDAWRLIAQRLFVAVNQGSTYIEHYRYLGIALINSGQVELARTTLERALQIDPQDMRIRQLLLELQERE